MSKRTEVSEAIRRLIEYALPGAEVIGLGNEEETARRVPDAGLAIVRAGDPGEASVDISPLTYWYDHQYPIEIAVPKVPGQSGEDELDRALMAIGIAIERDRTLDGRCLWLEAEAPDTFDIRGDDQRGGRAARGCVLTITATYGTTNPLG